MIRTSLTGHTDGLADLAIEVGDVHAFVVIARCTSTGHRQHSDGLIDFRTLKAEDIINLAESDPLAAEHLERIRRARREAHTAETGQDVVPGLEGFLDNNGVVVTGGDVDHLTDPIVKTGDAPDDETELDEVPDTDAIAAWCALIDRVAELDAAVEAGGSKDRASIGELDRLFIELNEIVEGEEVLEDIVVQADGRYRDLIELPRLGIDADIEDSTVPPAEPEPIDGYDRMTVEHIIGFLDEFCETGDRMLGDDDRNRAQSLAKVAAVLDYELAHKARKGLVARLRTLAARFDTPPPAPTVEATDLEVPAAMAARDAADDIDL